MQPILIRTLKIPADMAGWMSDWKSLTYEITYYRVMKSLSQVMDKWIKVLSSGLNPATRKEISIGLLYCNLGYHHIHFKVEALI